MNCQISVKIDRYFDVVQRMDRLRVKKWSIIGRL